MKFSIITISYNPGRLLKDTIDSVLSQNYPNIEYIIIDGGSTDGTVDMIKSYDGSISRYISEPDKGLYDTLNKGIALPQVTSLALFMPMIFWLTTGF